jgi:aminoglycoside 6'-N-acetyltransferase
VNVLISEGGLTIRKMEGDAADLGLFLKWMTDPQTMKYWDGMTERYTYDRVAEGYRKHLEEGVTPCILVYNGAPIGYFQFCPIRNAGDYEVPEKLYSQFVNESETVYGIDMFLGEAACRDRGLGTASLLLLSKALFRDYRADLLLIDPKVHNARAICCYHKCGFEDYFTVPHRELQDGVYHDSLIMGLRRADPRQGLRIPPENAAKGFSCQEVDEKDFSGYLRMKRDCFEAYVDEYYGGWAEEDQLRMNRETFEKTCGQTCFQKILWNGELAGFWGYDEREDRIGGLTIQLIEAARNQGLGSFFLREITALSDRTGKPAFLQVFRFNPAQNLYSRFGFRVYETTASHYHMRYDPPGKEERKEGRPFERSGILRREQ